MTSASAPGHASRKAPPFILACLAPALLLPAPAQAAGLGEMGLDLYGNLDVMGYRYVADGAVERTWNLNGLRESVLGVKTAEPAEGASGSRPILNLELGFGTPRGERGRTFDFGGREAYAGWAGNWGEITLGQQYNVMTNIAWNTLNPMDNGWGVYTTDLLYLGDTFTYDHGDATGTLKAGSNWFLGYLQRSAIYQYKGGGFTLQADLAPGPHNAARGGSAGLGGTVDLGKVQLAAAAMRQGNQDGSGHRDNLVLGGTWDLGAIKLYLAHLQSGTSGVARYDIEYGGVGWQVRPKLHLSLGHARYRQNESAAWGSGHATGWSFVADYSLNDKTTLYVETDAKRHYQGSDGMQTFYLDPGSERNLMFGFSRAL